MSLHTVHSSGLVFLLVALLKSGNEMLEAQGIVVERDDEFVVVQTQRQSSCGQCTISQNCATSSLAQMFGGQQAQMKVMNHDNIQVGDQVVIGLPEGALLKGSIILYLLPLFTLLIAALSYEFLAAALHWPHYEWLTVIVGLFGLWLGLIGVKRLSVQLSEQAQYRPVVLRILAGNTQLNGIPITVDRHSPHSPAASE
ncbi:MAG: SoxR reducing system RseC family protein [Pseudomonadota bacterium]|nr:SoxR reducing system RseC family protein [Pseudomonadota bacterium]